MKKSLQNRPDKSFHQTKKASVLGWVLLPGLALLGFIFFILWSLGVSFMEGTSVPIETIENERRATDLTSLFRLPGQTREEFIKSQEINVGDRPLTYEESLIYLQEYNVMNADRGNVLTYETKDGEEKFAGYNPGRLSSQDLRQTSIVRTRVPSVSRASSGTYFSSAQKSDTHTFLLKNNMIEEEESDLPPYLASARPAFTSRSTLTSRDLARTIINRGVVKKPSPAPQPPVQRTLSLLVTSPEKKENPVASSGYIPSDVNDVVRMRINGEWVTMREYFGAESQKDTTRPTVALRSQYNERIYGGGFRIFIDFSEFVQDFDEYDLEITNARMKNFRRIDVKSFYVDLESLKDDEKITFFIPENAAYDEAKNGNQASRKLTLP